MQQRPDPSIPADSARINRRFASLDISRGFAITCMILAHMPVIFWVFNDVGGMLASPFFLLVSGVSYQFFIASETNDHHDHNMFFLKVIPRSLLIYAIPLIPYFIVCFLFPSDFSFRFIHWGVFQVIAVGYVLGYFVHRKRMMKIISVLLVFSATLIITVYFSSSPGILVSDHTPVLPFLAYFFIGQLIYEIYLFPPDKSLLLSCSTFFIVLFGFLLFSCAGVPFNDYSRSQIPTIFLISAFFLGVMVFLVQIVDNKNFLLKILDPLRRIGKISFSSYYLHYILVIGLGWVLLQFNFSPIFVIPCTLLIIISLAALEKYWETVNFIFGLEWMIRTGSNRIARLIRIFL